jgi:hypothetical protein
MSAYTKLDRQDAFITPYTAYKSWTVRTSKFVDYNIQKLDVVSGSRDTIGSGSQYVSGDLFTSINHLYYSRNQEVTSSYENYLQTTLFESSSREVSSSLKVYTLPRDIFGTGIRPGSFRIVGEQEEVGSEAGSYIPNDYLISDYIGIELSGSPGYTGSLILFDDYEGNILRSGTGEKVGDIIYSHGTVIITDSGVSEEIDNLDETLITTGSSGEILGQGMITEWQSSLPIYTHHYRCKVTEDQLNHTTNLSATTGSSKVTYDSLEVDTILKSEYLDNVTGSNFQPYITSIGLYNEAHELVAVAKTSQPVPKSRYGDMTFVVNLDI